MRVFKFGGASVKDAKGVKNMASIVNKSDGNLVIVVSAMGKMTNSFEKLLKAYVQNDETKWEEFRIIKNYHIEIIDNLFESHHKIYAQVDALFFNIEDRLNRTPSINYDFEYDQLVGYGELISTKIISAYLNLTGKQNQ